MHRLWEMLLGLDKGFLARDGELQWHFSPVWPKRALIDLGGFNWLLGIGLAVLLGWLVSPSGKRWLATRPAARAIRTAGILGSFALLLCLLSGAAAWNTVLALAALVLVVYVYRRDGRSFFARISLGVMRVALIAFVLSLLNRPVVTLVQSVNEPSVLAIAIDDTVSMQVRDADPSGKPLARLEAIENLLTADNAATLHELAKTHVLKFFRFSSGGGASAAEPIATLDAKDDSNKSKEERDKAAAAYGPVVDALHGVQAIGTSTQVISSVRSVLDSLQGQRVAGVVVLTDGRDTPAENLADGVAAVKQFGVKVYPVAVGSENAPRNIDIRSVAVQDSAFKGDIVNVKAVVHGSGYEAGHLVHLALVDGRTKLPLKGADGVQVTKDVPLPDDKPQNVEMQFKADQVGMFDVTVQAAPQPGEISDKDNQRMSPVEVLDAKINVFYVEGYPRWEYRYIKNEMIREPTVNLSCYLQSADTGFAQEHSRPDPSQNLKYFPFREFPTTIEQLQEADVVLFGDVDVQRLSDPQLQLVRQFVEEYGGGFGMIAGTRWSPIAYRNTPLQDLLPVSIADAQPDDPSATLTQGFRPIVTHEGEDSSIFRFFPDREQNEQYLKERIQPIFWYFKGITPKPGLAEVYAEHPTDTLPDGRKAPILVVGHFGAGNTLFSATDESWRWRFYTGESIFNTYWVQQLRYLARSKKIGSRGMTFTSLRDVYEVGEQVRLSLHILNRKLLQQLPDQLSVELVGQDGQVVRRENLVRQEGQADTYVAQFPADRIGTFTARLPPITAEAKEMNVRIDVNVPARELEQPQVDRTLLSRLASETNALLPGQAEPKLLDLASARTDLAKIPSAAQSIPIFSDNPLWDAPLALLIFVLLITSEWVLRKMFGMV